MFEKKLRSIVVVCLLAVMMLSAGIVILPSASALTWTQDDETEFSQGTFSSTEVVGTGPTAYVALVQDFENWGDLDPALEPAAREGPVMAYDSTRDVFIMFGGYEGGYLSDTWEYDHSTNAWTEITTVGIPPGREWSSLAYDSTNDVFVLFGGFGVGGALADTWEYDPSTLTWTETTPGASPGTMNSYALTFDSSAGKVIMAAEDFVTSTFQTWAYDASMDSWLIGLPPTSPEKRTFHTIAYNPSIGRTVLFGGADASVLPPIFYTNVWEYDYSSGTWAETSPGSGPSARFGHAMAYRAFDQSVVLYGGNEEGGGYPTDTWKYEYISGSETWTSIGTLDNPGQRGYTSMDYDSLNNGTIIFGGRSGLGSVNDTWELGSFYTSQGNFVSSFFDSRYTDTVWQNIWWNLTPISQPPNTNMEFQLAVSNWSTGPWDWTGWDGTFSTYYTNPGEQIWSGLVGRYLKYNARLITFDRLDTPHMDDVTIVYTIPPLPPKVTETDPAPFDGTEWVEITRNITVLFSEPMSTGTVTWEILPNPGGLWTTEWDTAGATLYLNHTVPFDETTVYTARITAGQDLDGNDLVSLPYVWVFITVSIPPYIVETEPADIVVDVAIDYPLWINFSEPMDTATVVWTIAPDPNPSSWVDQWQNNNQTLYLTHPSDYVQCTPYFVEVTDGKDPKGNDLTFGPVPNPWRFDTICLNPFIQTTDPVDRQLDVPLDYEINVTFGKEVDSTTLLWSIDPDPGGVWTPIWGPQNITLVLDHSNPFTDCTPHTVEILDIQDLGGAHLIPGPVANPWTFMTICANPHIIGANPYDGAEDVLTYQNITIDFSKTVDRTTFDWSITPDPGSWTEYWIPGDTGVQLNHTSLLGQCTNYTVNVTYVEDFSGNPLVPGVVPNPWMFSTICNMPVIAVTDPVNASILVPLVAPIIIDFNKPINTTTFSWFIVPDPDPGGWGEAWSNGNMTVTLTHPTLYDEASLYAVAVASAEDEDGNALVPGPVPNPWEFTTGSALPYIVLTDPWAGEMNVELDRIVNITFSEPMNEPTVSWDIVPDPDPGGWTEQWLLGGTLLSLSHPTPFSECGFYTFNVTYGEDLAGNPLISGPVPNPFGFSPICVSPVIIQTYPANNTPNFPMNGSLVINFSEPMNTSTVIVASSPPTLHSTTWSNNNMTLNVTHAMPYAECTEYSILTSGEDMDGNSLVPGPVPNPFYFTTVCENPQILLTDPYDGEIVVDVTAPVVITFSEEMDNGTVTWNIAPDPDPGGWGESWESNNTVLNLTHPTPFDPMTMYLVDVPTGDDTAGLPLIPGPVPNPWTFTTGIPNPYIMSTDPIDGDTDVPPDASIVVDFNKEIDTATFQWTIVPDPDPGGWGEVWSNGNMTVTLDHPTAFAPVMLYTVTVTDADDTSGNPLGPGPVPNPWVFTTGVSVNPQIDNTNPADGTIGIPVTSSIWINFSEEINVPTFAWMINPVIPGAIWTESWTNGNTTVKLAHDLPYAEDTLYTVTVTSADDMDGNPLIPGPVPNPWSFTTEIVPPYIVNTYPPDGAIDIPLDSNIWVNFSEPMDTGALVWSIIPDPGAWTPTWLPGDMTLVLSHVNPYAECTNYIVTISAQDLQGEPLVLGPAPNPWTFTAVCINPYITTTDPFGGQTNVALDYDIIITFSEPIDVLAPFVWTITPDPGTWTDVWTGGDTIVTLSHANPFVECENYTVTVVEAYDLSGLPLVPGLVPNPWYFYTSCPLMPPSGLTVTRVFPTNVRLDWNAVPGADSYNVYESPDRFSPFPSGWNVVNTVNNFIEFAHLDDGLTHYYIARAFASPTESSNSTMGVKIDKAFTINPLRPNIYWMSLPYNSEYATASDIANELTESNVNVIAKWDRASQKVLSYYYARGKWRGNDFTLSPGDGFYVNAISNFNWDIVGTDSTTTIDMPFSPIVFKKNEHWISVPYTGKYAIASDIVIDIEGGTGPGNNTYIVEVGKWDPSIQGSMKYYYDPTGWTGVDFAIEPGDGIYIKVVATFSWQPELLTPEES